MVGESVSVTGSTVCQMDRAVATASPIVRRGCATALTSAGIADVRDCSRSRRAPSSPARATAQDVDLARRCLARPPPDSIVGAGGCRSRSNTSDASCIAPMPSASTWCSFVTSAARPPSSPSTRVVSHNGRAWSKPAIAEIRASSTTVASVAGGGACTRRRWKPRSKSGSSAHTSGVSRVGGSPMRWRIIGMSCVARSVRATSAGQSGEQSNSAIPSVVDRRWGSDSRIQRNASFWCSGVRTTSTMTVPPVRPAWRIAPPPAEHQGRTSVPQRGRSNHCPATLRCRLSAVTASDSASWSVVTSEADRSSCARFPRCRR